MQFRYRQEALAAGATKDQLGICDKKAANEAAQNPIDLEDWDGAFFDGSWFDFGEFGSTLGGEVGAIGDGFAGIYYSLPIIGNPRAANAAFASAYKNGPLGQSANGPWWSYGGTRFFLGIGALAGTLAGGALVYDGLLATGSGQLIYGRYGDAGHFMARVGNGDIYHALGAIGRARLGGMGSAELASTPIRWVLTMPLRNPGATVVNAAAASSAGTSYYNCFTAALRVLISGI